MKMTHLTSMKFFLLVFINFLSLHSYAQKDASVKNLKRPNIIFIYTDDQRFDALGVVQNEQGSKARFPWFETPHLDRLAKEGVRFRNAFVINSLCSPSRSTLLNGKYNHLNGIANNHTFLSDTSLTYATELQKHGYITGFVGKWHMGKQTGKRPGFHYSASFIGQGQYNDCPFEINGMETSTKGWVDDVSTDFAISFINKNKDQNFAVALAFKSGHGPFQPPARHAQTFSSVPLIKPSTEHLVVPYKGKVDGGRKPTTPPAPLKSNSWTENNEERIRNYFGCLKAVDENVGRILKTLDSLGIAENTVVLFSSDNGFFFGEHGLGDKRAAYEESIRVPLLARYPARFPKGKLIDQIVLNLDAAPTILDLAGIPAPASFQGKSWLPLVLDKQVVWRKSFLYEYFYEQGYALPTIKAVRTETGKLIQYPGQDDWAEVYDLKNDPQETKNLINAPEGVKLKQSLEKELAEQEKIYHYTIPEYADQRILDEQGKYKQPEIGIQ